MQIAWGGGGSQSPTGRWVQVVGGLSSAPEPESLGGTPRGLLCHRGGELVKNVEICGILREFVENGRNFNKFGRNLSKFVENFVENLLEIVENW